MSRKGQTKFSRVPEPVIAALKDYGIWKPFVNRYNLAHSKTKRRVKKNPKTGKHERWGWIGLGLNHGQSLVYAWRGVHLRFFKGFLKENGMDVPLPDTDEAGLKKIEAGEWELLRDAARNRKATHKEVSEWVAQNAYNTPKEVHRPDIPSVAAVNMLKWVQESPINAAKFWEKRMAGANTKAVIEGEAGDGAENDDEVDEETDDLLGTIEKVRNAGKAKKE